MCVSPPKTASFTPCWRQPDGQLGRRYSGIVGESGSGKSVTSMSIIGLLDPSATIDGSVKIRGFEILGQSDGYM